MSGAHFSREDAVVLCVAPGSRVMFCPNRRKKVSLQSDFVRTIFSGQARFRDRLPARAAQVLGRLELLTEEYGGPPSVAGRLLYRPGSPPSHVSLTGGSHRASK